METARIENFWKTLGVRRRRKGCSFRKCGVEGRYISDGGRLGSF